MRLFAVKPTAELSSLLGFFFKRKTMQKNLIHLPFMLSSFNTRWQLVSLLKRKRVDRYQTCFLYHLYQNILMFTFLIHILQRFTKTCVLSNLRTNIYGVTMLLRVFLIMETKFYYHIVIKMVEWILLNYTIKV